MGLHPHILVNISVFFLFLSIEFVDLICRYGISDCDCNIVSHPYGSELLLHCDNSTIQDQIGLYSERAYVELWLSFAVGSCPYTAATY